MKRFNKLFIILLCCVGAMSVTSCLNSDDGYSLDPELVRQYLTQMSGFYYGQNSDWRYQNKIYYYYDDEENNSIKTDSILGVVVNISARDTSFTVGNVSGKVLAKQVPDSHKELKQALEDYSQQLTIRGKFNITNISQNAYFTIYNTSVTIDNLEYGGGNHKVTVAFWGYPYSSGAYGLVDSYNIIEMYLCMGAVFVDDSQTALFELPVSSDVDRAKATLFARVTR